MTKESSLVVEIPTPGVVRLTFNRPEAHNAFDTPTFMHFAEELKRAAADAAVRAIVIGARGGRAFSAGFDIREMAAHDGEAMRAAFVRRDPVFAQVSSHRCPVIAAIDGICYGAGALLALAADLRLATPSFRLKVTAVGYGGANATWSLPPLIGPARAKEILMTGRVVEADEALAIGIVNRIVPACDLDAEALALASTIAAHPPEGIERIKQLVDAGRGRSPRDGWRAEHEWMLASFGSAQRGGGAVFDTFLSRRPPRIDEEPTHDDHS
jgi:enoyl-CoA hydratase/carnithine racemase